MPILHTLFFYTLPFIFVLGLIVFIHEFGHFIVGRWCGVKADVFSMGFGPELWSRFDKKGTKWRLALFPLGGYVKFAGDLNAASEVDNEFMASLSPEELAHTFPAQPIWKRALIVAAGPFSNFLLTIVLLTGLFTFFGQETLPPRVASISAGDAGEMAGIKPGDVILAINQDKISTWEDIQQHIRVSAGVPLQLLILRDGHNISLTATPVQKPLTIFSHTEMVGMLGILPSTAREDVILKTYSPGEAFVISLHETATLVETTFQFIGGIIEGHRSASELSGPIGIARMAGDIAQVSFIALLHLAALLSVSVGVLNILPIPMLDGGHLFFYGIESILRHPVSARIQEISARIGFALIICLMLFATFFDLKPFMSFFRG